MDYEKKYKDLVEAVKTLTEANPSDEGIQNWVKDNVPELQKSEDERIRKCICLCLEECVHNDIIRDYEKDKCLAWLKKQGEAKESSIPQHEGTQKDTSCKENDDSLTSEDERMRKAIYIYLDWLEGRKDYAPKGKYSIRDMLAWLEKQGEQKHTDKTESKFKAGDIIRRKAPSSYDKDMQVARIEKDYYICNHIGKFSSEVVPFSKESCYELVEQKPSDNVKPKFHEGEWCIDNEDDTIFQIVKVLDNIYTYRTNKGKEYSCTHYSLENDVRLWIVENANDGDVLAYKDEISIYKHDIKNCTKEDANFGGFVYHCCYDGKRFITDSLYSLTEKDKKDIYPATKEQRDFLFQKMKGAGYEWDVEKKELKKIENEIEIPFGAKDSELQEASYHIPKGFYAVLDGNKVIIKRFKNPRPQNN